MRIYSFKKDILEKAVENNFIKVEERGDGYSLTRSGIYMIISLEEHKSKQWIHVSVSRHNKVPTYNDLTMIKNIFIGPDKKAIQVFPPANEHVNISEYCLHLFHCIDEDILPDFTGGTGSL